MALHILSLGLARRRCPQNHKLVNSMWTNAYPLDIILCIHLSGSFFLFVTSTGQVLARVQATSQIIHAKEILAKKLKN